MRVLLFTLAACGRIGFDPAGTRTLDAPDAAATDPTLVVHFKFDEAAGATIENSAQPARPGHCVMNCPALVTGKYGQAYQFANATTGVSVIDDTDLRLTTGTLALWVRLDDVPSVGNFAVLAGKPYGPGITNSWEMFLSNTNGLLVAAGGDSTANEFVGKAWAIPNGEWAHVAYTWTPSQSRLYLNGGMVGSGAGLAPLFDDHDLLIGVDFDNGVFGRATNGSIDDVRLYSRVLSSVEIAAL